MRFVSKLLGLARGLASATRHVTIPIFPMAPWVSVYANQISVRMNVDWCTRHVIHDR